MILVLDQSTNSTGYAIGEIIAEDIHLRQYGYVKVNKGLHYTYRILGICESINKEILEKFDIEEVFMEDIQPQKFIKKDKKGKSILVYKFDTFQVLSELRGALLLYFLEKLVNINNPINVNKWRKSKELQQELKMKNITKETLHKKMREKMNEGKEKIDKFPNDVSDVLGLFIYIGKFLYKKNIIYCNNYIIIK